MGHLTGVDGIVFNCIGGANDMGVFKTGNAVYEFDLYIEREG